MMPRTSAPIREYGSSSEFNNYGRTSQFPGPSAHGSMDGRPRPLEPDLKSAGPPSPAHSPDLIDPFAGLQRATINRSFHPTDDFARPLPRGPLRDWYNSQEKPWDPIHGRNPLQPRTGDLRTARLNYRPSGPAFSVYRESNAPSECESTGPGVLPSDSGYESRTRHSVVNGSIYEDGDRTGETGSISSHLADTQLDRLAISSEPRRQGSGHAAGASANGGSGQLECPYCNQKVKTKSELKKHKQKHEKPHHCDVPDCTRTEGFSTLNDVARHKRCRHPEHNVSGKYYKCSIQGCRNKDKRWPRADNFRSHLKRLHSYQPREDALEEFVDKMPSLSGPDPLSAGSSVGDSLISMNITQNGTALTPHSWQFIDPQTTLLPLQEQSSNSGTSNYAEHQREFLQNAVINQQQFQALSAYGAVEEIPATIMQMSPFESSTENVLVQLEDSHSKPYDHQALTESIDMSSDEDFNEARFLIEDSVSDGKGAPGDEDPDDKQNTTPALSSVEKLGQAADRAMQSTQGDNETAPAGTEDRNDSSDTLAREYRNPPATVSPGTTASADDCGQRMAGGERVIAQPEIAALKESSIIRHIVNDKSKATDLIKALEDRGDLAELLEKHGYQKSRPTDSNTNTAPFRNMVNDDNQVTCKAPNCGKVFPRPCELKKHQKRHDKPYGCTFPKCSKRFGSKNDWKRHENSQHHELELWKCYEQSKSDPSKLCGKACHRREHFKFHLSKDHEIADTDKVDLMIEQCKIGRSCEVRFWCGFCREIVEVQDGGLKAWTERFNHIDNHFSGRKSAKRSISEWEEPDSADVDLISSGSNDESRSALPRPSSGPSYETINARKRGAETGSQNQRSQKRARNVETLWFCCHCGNQSLTSTSMNCCMDDCNGHIKCSNCRIEQVPREALDLAQV